MQPIVTDRAAWCLSVCLSVGLSVSHSSEPCKKIAQLIEMPFGLRTGVGLRNHVLDGVHIPDVKVQKWLNQSICRLGCGLRLAEGSTSSIVFARLCQCAVMGGHIDATWQIQLNHLSAAVMRLYVKLLWPLVERTIQTWKTAKTTACRH